MADLTPEQIQRIRQIISDHHWAFVANNVGPGSVPVAILEDLKAKGLVDASVEFPKEAFTYGKALSSDPRVAGMSLDEYRKWNRNQPTPLSEPEQRAVEFASIRAAEHITGIGERMRQQVVNAVVDNIQTRGTSGQLKSTLASMSQDWNRNWNRVAVTEKHNAMQQGQASHIASTSGRDALVSKRPMPDACPHCKRLHLGPDGQPRIFKLSDLEANGSNVGRKAADWLPTVGTVHPHCQCVLIEVPDGWGYNEDGELVPGGELGALYGGPEDVRKAILEEDDLIKAWTLKDRITFQGIPIAIENRAGSYREWKAPDGTKGKTRMKYAYGYVENTMGQDEDEIDVYVGPDPRAKFAYIITQQSPEVGTYDEDKVMLGFSSAAHAKSVYLEHYDNPEFYVTLTPMPIDHFKRWVTGTAPAEGEMMKGMPLVILEKGHALSDPVGKINSNLATERDPMGNRNPAGRQGDGANQFFHIPRNHATKPHEDVKDDIKLFVYQGKNNAMKPYKDIEKEYGAMHATPVPMHDFDEDELIDPYVVPERSKDDKKRAKKHPDKKLNDNRAAVPNKIEDLQ